jgi:hypothetical protein
MDNFKSLPSLNGLVSEAPTLVDLNLLNARLPQLVMGRDVLRNPLSLSSAAHSLVARLKATLPSAPAPYFMT